MNQKSLEKYLISAIQNYLLKRIIVSDNTVFLHVDTLPYISHSNGLNDCIEGSPGHVTVSHGKFKHPVIYRLAM